VSLTDWLKYGWLTEHQPTAAEIRDLFAVIERDLADSGLAALSSDWRLNIAYNAALQAATAALAACGYRAARESHHYRVLQSLAYSIGSPRTFISRLDLFRKKRNLGEYERAGGRFGAGGSRDDRTGPRPSHGSTTLVLGPSSRVALSRTVTVRPGV
jgi:hypothetical protein